MRRADRLFRIVQMLGRRKRLSADALANRLEVSTRTIYRDVQDLARSGIPIQGEPGKGYRLLDGYHVPPLMFDEDELQALAFGAEVAKAWGDESLSEAVDRSLDKIAAVLPPHLRPRMRLFHTYVADFHVPETVTKHVGTVRRAMKANRKVQMRYRDANEALTDRVVWPLGLIYWGAAWTLAGWCELREDFRTFRLDRIVSIGVLQQLIPSTIDRSLNDYFAVMER